MNAKEYTLQFELRDDYLYAHLEGKDSFSAGIEYWTRIANKVRDLELTKVLVHENLVGEISEGEIFEIVQDVLPVSTGIHIALFDEQVGNSELNELGVLMAQNRGIDIEIFQSLEAAEKWIKET
ncbi:hypothetical protein P4C99_21115 [Pontiellaceae bacterium B1224]|nr:hypothetical protein [Pontiellaceae bacterium B1224]